MENIICKCINCGKTIKFDDHFSLNNNGRYCSNFCRNKVKLDKIKMERIRLWCHQYGINKAPRSFVGKEKIMEILKEMKENNPKMKDEDIIESILKMFFNDYIDSLMKYDVKIKEYIPFKISIPELDPII